MLWFCVVFVVFDHNCRGCRGSLSCQETHDGQVLLRCECGTYGCSSCSSSSSSSLYSSSSSSSSSCQRAIRVVSRTLGILCTGRVRLYIVIYIYTYICHITRETGAALLGNHSKEPKATSSLCYYHVPFDGAQAPYSGYTSGYLTAQREIRSKVFQYLQEDLESLPFLKIDRSYVHSCSCSI